MNYRLNWNKKDNLWHFMVAGFTNGSFHKVLIATCETDKTSLVPSILNRHVAFISIDSNESGTETGYPDGTEVKEKGLLFNQICPKCLKIENVNIKDFKHWLVLEKLKIKS